MSSSRGTKVDLGKDAPVTGEGPGEVFSDSLASESQAFRDANKVSSEQFDKPQESPARAPGTSTHHSSKTDSQSQSHATAPSYVQNQFHRDTAGPHGKNLTEDPNMTEDSGKNASFNAEIGSKDDPSLLAEQKMNMRNSDVVGSSGGREVGIDNKTPYDVLGNEEDA
ncbi:hypothetical protein F5Y16DRAFT_364116 [Xylariaceae sp. FL0255]|nr:hypothetical protein F5Y16DRAFT_364116 [Xylariaceae sp. FL0255]